jgi:hypothetical protein
MTTTASPSDDLELPPMGHNNPPSLAEILKEKHAGLFAALDELRELANGAPKEAESDQQAIDLASIAEDAAKVKKKLETTRVAEKEPHLKASREVDGTFREPIDICDTIDRRLMQRVTIWNKKKAAAALAVQQAKEAEERRIAEEARQAAEAALASGRTEDAMADLADATHAEERAEEIAAAAPEAAAPEKLQSDDGLSIGTQKTWAFEITDFSAVPLDELRNLIKRDAIEAAIRLLVRNGGRSLKGVRIYQEETAKRSRR